MTDVNIQDFILKGSVKTKIAYHFVIPIVKDMFTSTFCSQILRKAE